MRPPACLPACLQCATQPFERGAVLPAPQGQCGSQGLLLFVWCARTIRPPPGGGGGGASLSPSLSPSLPRRPRPVFVWPIGWPPRGTGPLATWPHGHTAQSLCSARCGVRQRHRMPQGPTGHADEPSTACLLVHADEPCAARVFANKRTNERCTVQVLGQPGSESGRVQHGLLHYRVVSKQLHRPPQHGRQARHLASTRGKARVAQCQQHLYARVLCKAAPQRPLAPMARMRCWH